MRPGPAGAFGDILLSIDGSEIHQRLFEAIPIPQRVLEVGSGCGKLSLYLANRGTQVTLLEPDPDMRQYCSDLFRVIEAYARLCQVDPKQFQICLRDGDARNMPDIADNTYDLVWNEGLIEHFQTEEQRKILAEMTRVSRTWVSLVFPDARIKENWDVHAQLESNYHGFDHGHEKPLMPEEWRALFNSAGLEVVYEAKVHGRMMIVVGRKRGALEVRG